MTRRRRSGSAPRVALALAGGGPLGAIHEIGALCALEDCIQGLDLNRLDHYVGVSAGGFIAAALANGLTPRQLCAGFIESSGADGDVFDPSWLMVPAWGEFMRRGLRLPGLTASTLWRIFVERQSPIAAFERLAPALPTGVFASEEVHRQLSRMFSRPGRSNDFRQLRARLTLVATELDSGEAVPFGRPGWDHVPISRAVQASSALPGLFPPVRIDGRDYVDGALKKTMHASVALEDGVDLLICLNPLVPFDATLPGVPAEFLDDDSEPRPRIPRIVDGGLPAVLSQTFRSMIHSRMVLGIKGYEKAYPDTDIVLFEPDHRDPELYLANTFSYRQRRHLAEHAYQQTRQMLRARAAELAPRLARHRMAIRAAALDDPGLHLLVARAGANGLGQALGRLDHTLDRLGHALTHAGGRRSA